MHPRDQTIFALSSGRPPSAIALVRVSGPQAGKIVTALAGKLPPPRMATRALLRDVGQRPIDDAVVLWFPGPASATGEDVAEFHVHGGRAVLAVDTRIVYCGDCGAKMFARPSPGNLPGARSSTASSI